MPMPASSSSVSSVKSMIKEVQKDDKWMEEGGPAINNLPAKREGEDCFHSGTEGGKSKGGV